MEAWTSLFRKTCGQDWPRPKAGLDRLARFYSVEHDPARPQIVLFALQSWYVLLVKLLLGHVIAHARGRKSPLVNCNPGSVGGDRRLVESMESGDWFVELGVTDPCCGKSFRLIASAWSPALEKAVVEAIARIACYDSAAIAKTAAGGVDLLKPLYESLFPRAVRHALGEYYTPGWLAEHVLDQVGYFGQATTRLLDPTCGSGTFLLAALRRWRQNVPITLRRDVFPSRRSVMSTFSASGYPSPCPTDLIAGFDLHPLAVASARANYLLAIVDLIGPDAPIDVPVFDRDAILDQRLNEAPFDFVVGNPPWIAWDNLPGDYREATKPQWQRYGLFSLSGNDARHGGGKKDLSMLVLYAAADRYLAPAGRLGMVITQTLFQSKGAGDGFRGFRLGTSGPPLRILRVDDMVDVRPFGGAANWTSVVILQKGEPTVYPVQYVKWTPGKAGSGEQGAASTEQGAGSGKRRAKSVANHPSSLIANPSSLTPHPSSLFQTIDLLAQPVDPACPTSPWIVRPQGLPLDLSRIVGRADYTAHLGANSGGANAVYWLELQGRGVSGVRVRNLVGKSKRRAEPVEEEIEPDLLYPLVRWIDVDRWSARPSAHILLAQDPQTRAGRDEAHFRRDYPRSFAYLKRFESLLTTRAAYRRYQARQPFYSMYNVGLYTLAPWKVIWRRMDRKIRAAVVEPIIDPLLGPRPIIPQETCVLIACLSGDEAHYLCALLNSSLVHDLVASHSVTGGKGFGTPSILDYLPLRSFAAADPSHLELAALSRRLHSLAKEKRPDGPELAQIDRLSAAVLISR